MKKALIVTGGYINLNKVGITPNDFSLIIAADSGYSSAKKLNIVPEIVLGDFDSLSEKIVGSAEIITVPSEKDETDTMLACNVAIERGANELLILGGTGGRADHFLSNLFFMEALSEKGIPVTLTDGENTLRILQDETALVLNNNGYFSLFALDSCNVSLSGCKYPLSDYFLTRIDTLATSNEVVGEKATVTVKGKAILCESQK